jgi:DNA-binding PadR family transcriptional regulator
LRGSEVRALATIGAFRAVPADDLRDDGDRAGDVRHGDLERLREAGLIETVTPFERSGDRTTVVTLTDRGRQLLERHRAGDRERPQAFYTGVTKARELSHDAQLYRAYVRTADRLRAEGARIDRVVLDTELKREYQRFLQAPNRGRSDSDGRPGRTPTEIRHWAEDHDLPVVNDKVQFPDVRIEYERADGRRDVEDIEVTTLHYRGAHAAGKAAAGFTRFRGSTSRVGGRSGGGGRGSSLDPRLAEEMLE